LVGCLLESEANRLAFRFEIAQLREAGNWTGKLEKLRHKLGPWLGILASAAGVLFVMGFRRAAGGLSLLGKAVAVAGPLVQLWRKFNPPTDEET
jgi:hypothetical protein